MSMVNVIQEIASKYENIKMLTPFKLMGAAINYLPYKHSMWIPRWNDVETSVSTSFQRGIHGECL